MRMLTMLGTLPLSFERDSSSRRNRWRKPAGTVDDLPGCALVVNATPAGMAGVVDGPDRWPVDPDLLGPGQLVVDLVYHPPVTPWLAAAAGRGHARPPAWACSCTRPPCRSSG